MKNAFPLLFFAFSLFANLGYAEEAKMLPLSQIIERLDTEKPDPSEIAYIGIRCAALWTVIGGIFDEGARNEKEKEIAKRALKKGGVFLFVGSVFDKRFNKKSDEALQKQMLMFAKIYGESIKENKLLNNSIFSPMISDEIDASNSVYEMYQLLEKNIKDQPGTQK